MKICGHCRPRLLLASIYGICHGPTTISSIVGNTRFRGNLRVVPESHDSGNDIGQWQEAWASLTHREFQYFEGLKTEL